MSATRSGPNPTWPAVDTASAKALRRACLVPACRSPPSAWQAAAAPRAPRFGPLPHSDRPRPCDSLTYQEKT